VTSTAAGRPGGGENSIKLTGSAVIRNVVAKVRRQRRIYADGVEVTNVRSPTAATISFLTALWQRLRRGDASSLSSRILHHHAINIAPITSP
jgi:hypothetical protein